MSVIVCLNMGLLLLASLVVVVVDAQNTNSQTEIARRVLVALGCKNSCDCGTDALVCNGGKVTQLHFYAFSATASISTEIGLLTDLEELNLSTSEGEELTGTVPTELKGLTRITFLDISGSRELASDFATFLALTSLTELTIGKSKLRGTLDGIERLSHLVELAVDETLMNGTLPTALGSLKDLKGLYVDASRFVGTLPTQLSNLKKLERFWCSQSAFSGSIPKLSSTLKRDGCFLQDDDFVPIGCLNCSSLHESNDVCICDAAPAECLATLAVTLDTSTSTTTVQIGTGTSSGTSIVSSPSPTTVDAMIATPGVASTSSSSVSLGSVTSLPPDTLTITPGIGPTSSSSVALGSSPTASPPDAGLIAGVVAGVVCCLLMSAAVAAVVWWRKKSLSHEHAANVGPTLSSTPTPKSEYASVLVHLN
jgi:hypothetical protein